MSNRRKVRDLSDLLPKDPRGVIEAPADLVVAKGDATCEMLLPLPMHMRRPGGLSDAPCGRPAHYIFELAREQWAKMPQDNPIIAHACVKHGKDAREMPGLMWIKAL